MLKALTLNYSHLISVLVFFFFAFFCLLHFYIESVDILTCNNVPSWN